MQQDVESARYAASRRSILEASEFLPGGVTSNVRLHDVPAPLVFAAGRGARLVDVDGNEYIDYVLARGPMILGYNARSVQDRVCAATDEMLLCAAQTRWEREAAERICRIVPCAEKVRFSLSGTEAVQAALRMARAYTGRLKVLRFDGHYHGWVDSVLVARDEDAAEPWRARPLSAGQDPGACANTLVAVWNDLDSVRAVFDRFPRQIAAVIAEPVEVNPVTIPPRQGFLAELQRLCREHGTVLVFDEVITGFRLGLTGAQGLFGITPDLATFGKAVAGGYPLGVVAGRSDIMADVGSGRVNHSGTFNGHVTGLAAACATIDELSANGGEAYERIERAGSRLMDGIRAIFRGRGVPALVQGFPAVFTVAITSARALHTHRDRERTDTARYKELLCALMARGVRAIPEGTWMVSAAHTVADIDETLSRFADAVDSLQW